MDDADRKMLTEEVLGEEWDQSILAGGLPNRTFTTWQDTGDLKQRIVEMEEWRDFCVWANKKWEKEKFDNWKGEELFYFSFLDYFMDEIRFPELVAEWWGRGINPCFLKERKVKG